LATNSTCSTAYVLEVTNPANISVRGDPQFIGLRGQTYQVHGIDGGVYNLITDKTYQLNSRFTFLNGPRPCSIMPSTGQKSLACWTHPGSYISELGLKTADTELLISAGSAAVGFSAVTMKGIAIKVGESKGSVSFNTTHELTLRFGSWTIEVENSDMFVNLRSVHVAANSWSRLRTHGLLGQTWSNKRYSGPVIDIEGDVDDYLVANNSIFGTSFVFSMME